MNMREAQALAATFRAQGGHANAEPCGNTPESWRVSVYSAPAPHQRTRDLETALAQDNERADTAERERAEVVATYVVMRLWLERARGVIVAIRGYAAVADKEHRIDQVLGSIDDALAPNAGQALLAQVAAMRSVLLSIAGNAHVMTTIYDTLGPPYYAIGIALEGNAGATTLAELTRLRAIETAVRERASGCWLHVSHGGDCPALAALATPQAGGEVQP